MVVDKEVDMEWARIPHFYRDYYVYQYATGVSAAIAIATKIINKEAGIIEKYIEMLKQDLIKHNRYKDQIDFHLGFGQGGKCGKYMLPDVFLYDKNSDTIITIPDNQPIEMVINILKCNNMI